VTATDGADVAAIGYYIYNVLDGVTLDCNLDLAAVKK
jgi:hypothetical protein